MPKNRRCVRHTVDRPCPHLEFELRVRREASGAAHAVLYARSDGETVGAADVDIRGALLEVRVLYVRPAWRGLGIARAMLRHLGTLHPRLPLTCPPEGGTRDA